MKKIIVKANWWFIGGIGGLVGVILCGLGWYFTQTPDSTDNSWKGVQTSTVSSSTQRVAMSSKGTAKKRENEPSNTHEKILVDIKGAVAKPGVYEVAVDARLHQLVTLAGGVTEAAEVKGVNLAAKITDQQMIYIPYKGETVSELAGTTTASSPTGATASKKNAKNQEKINLNTASLTELQGLTGIGEKKAQAIIEYRTKNGEFQSVDQLTKVDGFGEKTVEKLRDSITI